MGSCKLGTDDGRLPDGTAVVDTNTKIYGTDNMFVVDASIWPGMPSTNPSALIVTASEHASDLILALPLPRKASVVKKNGQCGGFGFGWFGFGGGWGGFGRGNAVTCDGGLTCKAVNYFYSVVRYEHGCSLASCRFLEKRQIRSPLPIP
jgi:cellobiose dehydrogenase (acceptor)